MHWARVPDGLQWREITAAVSDGSEVDRDRLEKIAQLLDRARAVAEFDRIPLVGAILPLLSEWSDRYPQASPLRDRMQALWNVALPALQRSVVDVFASEYAIVADLVCYRYVTLQQVGSSLGLVIHHPLSRVTGVLHLLDRSEIQRAVERVAHEMGKRLPGDWVGEEMRAHLAGGNAATPDRTVDSISSALASVGVGSHQAVLLRRPGRQAPLHIMFDRWTGRLAPFSPAFDPIAFGLRTRHDQNRALVQSQEPHPELLRHLPGSL